MVGLKNVTTRSPATPAGIPAIRRAISEGININVPLLFARERYEEVAEAYLSGLEEFAAQGGDASKVSSAASFFVSRIDSLVDSILKSRLTSASGPAERALLRSVMGKVAIANAKLAYQRYREIFSPGRWRALRHKGAQTQGLLWASTSTKNPAYSDVHYVEELIGSDTVNTIPRATLEAFRDHGKPRARLEADLEEARDTMAGLDQLGSSMKDVTDQLLKEAVRLFVEAFEKLLNSLDRACKVPI